MPSLSYNITQTTIYLTTSKEVLIGTPKETDQADITTTPQTINCNPSNSSTTHGIYFITPPPSNNMGHASPITLHPRISID